MNDESISSIEVEETNEKLQQDIARLKSRYMLKKSNASILAIVQENQCLVRCMYEIQNTTWPNIDPLYGSKHDTIKRKIIDSIVDSFGDRLIVKSEHSLSTGKQDIILYVNNIIVLNHNRKRIAIEIKSGKTFDTKNIFQLERYLVECDMLIVIRVPYEQVDIIETSEKQRTAQIKNLSLLSRKIQRMSSGNVNNNIKIQGEWCIGCPVACEFKRVQTNGNNNHTASLTDYDNVMVNTEAVIEKTLSILAKIFDNEIQVDNRMIEVVPSLVSQTLEEASDK